MTEHMRRNPLEEALHAFQSEAPKLQKDSINPHFKSKFIGLDTLMDSVLPLLNKHGLVLTQFPTTVDGRPALRTRISCAASGEWLEDTMLVLGKEDPQGQGSGITYARRYALMAILGLVADVDDDGEVNYDRTNEAKSTGRRDTYVPKARTPNTNSEEF